MNIQYRKKFKDLMPALGFFRPAHNKFNRLPGEMAGQPFWFRLILLNTAGFSGVLPVFWISLLFFSIPSRRTLDVKKGWGFCRVYSRMDSLRKGINAFFPGYFNTGAFYAKHPNFRPMSYLFSARPSFFQIFYKQIGKAFLVPRFFLQPHFICH